MYYRDNFQACNEESNTDNYQDHDGNYQEFNANMADYGQQASYSPQYYQMMSFNPMMWNMQNLKNYEQYYRNKDSHNYEKYMPMTNMPMLEDEDGDLKMLYPEIYIRIYPMVKHHCDMMMSMYGTMYCPSKEDLEHISKEMCENYEKHYRDDEDDDNINHDEDDDMRKRRRFRRRRGFQDLIKVMLIKELLGGRHGGGYWW